MKPSERIRHMLIRVLGYTEGDANAATIERRRGDSGYGWYIKRFGDNTQGAYWESSVGEVSATMYGETEALDEEGHR
jgi:hypothetical protein